MAQDEAPIILGPDGRPIIGNLYNKPLKGSYQQIPLQAFSDWSTVIMVKQTLNELEQGGNFRMPALLWDAMGRDDRISAVFETRINSLNGLPFELEPADDSAKAERVASEIKQLWSKMIPEALLNNLRSRGLGVQLGIAEIDWEDAGSGMWIPTLRDWDPQYAYWRWDKWTYWMSTQDQGQVELMPGADGGYKWVLYTPAGPVRGWMKALVRSLSIPWLIRQWNWRDWARFNEIHGMPIRAGIVPQGGDETHKERFLNEIAALGNETVVRLEQGEKEKFDFKLVEAMSTNWEIFEKLHHRADTAVAVRMLGQNLTTEAGAAGSGSGGARGMGQIHDRVRADFLRSDSTTVGEAIREQHLEPMCLFNYGDKELAPRPIWKTDPPDDNVQKSTVLMNVGTALNSLRQAGLNVDLVVLAQQYAIPLIESEPTIEPSEPQQIGPDGKPIDTGGASPGTIGKPQDGSPEFDPNKKKKAPGGGMGFQSARRTVKPHHEGQAFTNRLKDGGAVEAKRLLRSDLAKVLACVEKANDWVHLKHMLAKTFEGMDSGKLAKVMKAALALAEMNGRHSVLEE